MELLGSNLVKGLVEVMIMMTQQQWTTGRCLRTVSGAIAGVLVGWATAPVQAIPGQTTDVAAAWVRDNPVLNPGPGETLLIQRTEPDGTRFTFQSQVAPPGRLTTPPDREMIRSERMTFFVPGGVTPELLEQSIQDIYGPEIAADLETSEEVLRYPSPEVLAAPVTDENFLQRAIQGVIRQGEQFVYWLELTQNRDGTVQQGQVVIFEPEWLPKVQKEVEERQRVN